METAALRDKMQERVKETYAKYRNFEDLPVIKDLVASKANVALLGDGNADYVIALHEFFAIDPDKIEIAGRHGRTIVAK